MSLFVCEVCSDYLKDPVNLPCHCVTCESHVNTRSLTKCPLKSCGKVYAHAEIAFTANTKMRQAMERDEHLSERERALKARLVAASQFSEANSKHFGGARAQIEIRRRTLKQNIDSIADTLVQQSEMLERGLQLKVGSDFAEKIDSALLATFQRPNQQLSDETLLSELDEMCAKVEATKREVASVQFVTNFSLQNQSDLFGFFLSCDTKEDASDEPKKVAKKGPTKAAENEVETDWVRPKIHFFNFIFVAKQKKTKINLRFFFGFPRGE